MSFSSVFAATGDKQTSSLGTYIKIGTAIAATASAAYLFYFNTSRITSYLNLRSSPRLSREEMRSLIRELLQEFHVVLVEMSQMATRFRHVLALKGMSDQVSDEQVVEVLMQQGVQEKMEAAQARVLASHALSESDVEEAQTAYADEPAVAAFESAIEQMFQSASKGSTPILPGAVIPSNLTPEVVLAVFDKLHAVKVELFTPVISKFYATNPLTNGPPAQALAEALQSASDEAEEIAMGSFDFPHRSVFHSAVSEFSNDPGFAAERKRQDRCHQTEIMRLVSNKRGPAQPVPALGISEKLAPVSEEELPLTLMDAAEKKVTVVVAMVRPGNDMREALKDLTDWLHGTGEIQDAVCEEVTESGNQEENQMDSKHQPIHTPPAPQISENSIFVYMFASEDSPLVQNEKCAGSDVIYVVFARPEIHKKPIACLSVAELEDVLERVVG